VTALDEIAWLFNLRGNDIEFNPVFIAYAIVTQEKITLYVSLNKLTEEVKKSLGEQVTYKPYEAVFDDVTQLSSQGKIWLDPAKSCCSL